MTLAGVLIVIGLCFLVWLMFYASKRSHGLNKDYYRKRWNEIQQTSTNGDSGMRVAVIDGDKLVDKALKDSHVHGDTMGERMKKASYLKSINNLWQAHKLRNKLVHEPDFKAKKSEMKSALGAYRKTLKEMGAL